MNVKFETKIFDAHDDTVGFLWLVITEMQVSLEWLELALIASKIMHFDVLTHNLNHRKPYWLYKCINYEQEVIMLCCFFLWDSVWTVYIKWRLCNQNVLEISIHAIYDLFFFPSVKILPSPLLTAHEALRNHEYVLYWWFLWSLGFCYTFSFTNIQPTIKILLPTLQKAMDYKDWNTFLKCHASQTLWWHPNQHF